MLNIISLPINENQKNPMRCHFTPTSMCVIKKIITNIGEEVEKLQPSYSAGGNVKFQQVLWKIFWSFLKSFKHKVPYGPAIQFLGTYTQEK